MVTISIGSFIAIILLAFGYGAIFYSAILNISRLEKTIEMMEIKEDDK